MNNKKEITNFKKLYLIQIYGYLILIPFVFAFFSLIKNYTNIEIVIYFSGLVFVLITLLINQFEPILRVTKNRFILYNTYTIRPIVLLRMDLKSFEKINDSLIKLRFKTKDYEVQLNKKDLIKFVNILKEID